MKNRRVAEADHFYDPAHQRIFDAIRYVDPAWTNCDPKTLRGLFENDPALAGVGGAQYLGDLAASIITIINAQDYAHLIHDLYLRRQLITLGEDVVNEAFVQDLDKPAIKQIEEAEHCLFELAQTGELNKGFVKLDKSLALSLRMADEAFKRDSHVTGITTGLRDLDRKLGGFQKSDLIILAGRPSMGKTALATNIAINAARAYADSVGKEGGAVAFFSLEMSSEQLARGLLGDYFQRPVRDKIRRGRNKQGHSQNLSRPTNFLSHAAALHR